MLIRLFLYCYSDNIVRGGGTQNINWHNFILVKFQNSHCTAIHCGKYWTQDWHVDDREHLEFAGIPQVANVESYSILQ